MRITKDEVVNIKKEIGYECNICHKKVEYKNDSYSKRNTVTWSHPSGGWNERHETETLDVCSLGCLLIVLNRISFGAEIKLSSSFLNSIQNESLSFDNWLIDQDGDIFFETSGKTKEFLRRSWNAGVESALKLFIKK